MALAGCKDLKRETLDRVTPHDESAWTSRGACEQLLPDRPDRSRPPRIGTWNVRYFPDSIEGEQEDPTDGTDVEWLACAIASLQVDLLAVQEFKNTPLALEKQQELLTQLNAFTGGDWRLELGQCRPEEVQHPGFLFDANRVSGEAFREIEVMNPDSECSNQVSPGFGGYFTFDGGPDFHFIAVHAYAGEAPEAHEKRGETLSVLEAVMADAATINPDTDLLFAGDFNTSGCPDCAPSLSSDDEIAEFDTTLAEFEPTLTRLPTSEGCSFVNEEHPLIDHVLVADGMAEVPPAAEVRVGGICQETGCGRLTNWLEDANDHLSDHCPLTLELDATDDD